MRRLSALLACVALVTVSACSDDGGSPDEGTGAPIPPAPTVIAEAGLVVGQESTDGRLQDAVVVVDPATGPTATVSIADLALAGAVPAGPGRAFYTSGDELVLLDASAGTITELGLSAGDHSPAVAALTGGIGERFAAIADGGGGGGGVALVDLTSGEVTDLGPVTEGATTYAAQLNADESAVLVSGDEVSFLVPTADPSGAEPVGDGFGQFIGDGSAVLLTGPDGTVVRDLATGDEVELSDDVDSGGLVLGNRVVLARDDEVQLVEPATGEVLATLPFQQQGDDSVVVGDVLLLGGGSRPWTSIDGSTARVTTVDELAGFAPASTPPAERWIPFESAATNDFSVVGVDTEDGSVVTLDALPRDEEISSFVDLADRGPWALVATSAPEQDDEPVTHGRLVNLDTGEVVDLGTGFQGGTISPDGRQVAWASGDEGEVRVAPVDDVSAAEVVTTGVAVPLWLAA